MFQQITSHQTQIFQQFSGLYRQKQTFYIKQIHIVCGVQDKSSTSTPFMQKCSVSVRKWIRSVKSRLLLQVLLNKILIHPLLLQSDTRFQTYQVLSFHEIVMISKRSAKNKVVW